MIKLLSGSFQGGVRRCPAWLRPEEKGARGLAFWNQVGVGVESERARAVRASVLSLIVWRRVPGVRGASETEFVELPNSFDFEIEVVSIGQRVRRTKVRE